MTSDSSIFSDRLSLRNRILTKKVKEADLQSFNDTIASGDALGAVRILGQTFYGASRLDSSKFELALKVDDIVRAISILAYDFYNHQQTTNNAKKSVVNESSLKKQMDMIRRRTQ